METQTQGPKTREAIYKNYFEKKKSRSLFAGAIHYLKYWSNNSRSIEVCKAKELLLTKTMLLNLILSSKRLTFSIFGQEEWQKAYDDP